MGIARTDLSTHRSTRHSLQEENKEADDLLASAGAGQGPPSYCWPGTSWALGPPS